MDDLTHLHVRLTPQAKKVLDRVTNALGVTAAGFLEAVIIRHGQALASDASLAAEAERIDKARRARPGPRQRR